MSLEETLKQMNYEILKRTIQEQGQLEPIILYNGNVLDGRHRLRAIQELGMKPQFRVLSKKRDASKKEKKSS